MKRRRETLNRLQSVLLFDKLQAPNNFCELVKRDLYSVLASYFEMNENSMDFYLDVTSEGAFIVTVTARATRLKNVPIII